MIHVELETDPSAVGDASLLPRSDRRAGQREGYHMETQRLRDGLVGGVLGSTPSRATRQSQVRERRSVSPSKASSRARNSKASSVAENHAWLSTVTAHVPRRSPMRCTTSARAVSGSRSWIR